MSLKGKDVCKMELKGAFHNWIYKKQRKELRQQLIEELKNTSYNDYSGNKLNAVNGSDLDIDIEDTSNNVIFKMNGKETRLRILFCFTSGLDEAIIKTFC